jgi:hypothetical protein
MSMRTWIVLLIAVCASPACAAYTFEDLPAGWAWDRDKIQGEILPANPGLADGDPNLWLVPLDSYRRNGATNRWVSKIEIMSVSSSFKMAPSLSQTYDPNTLWSLSWHIDAQAAPGPWYITVDATGYPGKTGLTAIRRYTVVGCGILPDDSEPELQ